MRKTILMAAFALLFSNAVMAQDCCKEGGHLKSYSFVEAQGGLQWTTTDAKIDKLLMPVGALSIGHYFSPAIGARLHVSGLQAKGRFEQFDKDYKWNYFTTDADLLVNLSSLFSKNYSRPLNVIFVGGLGLVNYWKNDDLQEIIAQQPALAPLARDNHHHLSHNLRAGLRLETNVTKPLGVSLEIDANSMEDRFNGKTNDADDWMIAGLIGISYRFGYKKECCKKEAPAPVPEPVPVVEEPAPVPVPVVVEEKKPEPKAVTKTETLHEAIFYVICKSNPVPGGNGEMQRVADFMNKYKDAKVMVVGYADKGTGNAKLNKMYSERRAAECKDALVNKFGCDASRITIDSKGDTVQPFTENDKNRCVIIDSKAQYTVYE